MRPGLLTAVVCGAALAGCGGEESLAPLPASGSAYRALGDARRLAVAESCRARAAAAADGEVAAEQLATRRRRSAACGARLGLPDPPRAAAPRRGRLPRPAAVRDARAAGQLRGRRGQRRRLHLRDAARTGRCASAARSTRRRARAAVVAAREFGAPQPVSGAIRPDGTFALPRGAAAQGRRQQLRRRDRRAAERAAEGRLQRDLPRLPRRRPAAGRLTRRVSPCGRGWARRAAAGPASWIDRRPRRVVQPVRAVALVHRQQRLERLRRVVDLRPRVAEL